MDTTSLVDTRFGFNFNLNPLSTDSSLPDSNPVPKFDVLDPQSNTQEKRDLVEELKRMKMENMMLSQTLALVLDNYTSLHNNYVSLMMSTSSSNTIHNVNNDINPSKKRKADSIDDQNQGYISKAECFFQRHRVFEPKPKVKRIHIQTEKDDKSLVVNDGYQWRKYGQKVTRDNPSPRAYFKCSFAPLCPVKKKVQRSAEDPTILVAIYEGEHNHNIYPSSSMNQNVAFMETHH